MKIRTQLLVFILGIVFLGFLAVILLSYKSSREIVSTEVYARADTLKGKYIDYFDGYFQIAAKVASVTTQILRVDENLSEEKIHLLIKENIIWNPEIYGMTVFLEPKPEDVGKKLFAPYYFRQGQILKYVPADPNFKFQEQSWYKLPKKQGSAVWTEPYFDIGAGALMTTFSTPIYRSGKFIGLATVDINLSVLSEKINNIQIGKTGYAILISRQGSFLTHPSPEDYVLKQKIQDVAKASSNPYFVELSAFMLKGRSGSLSLMDPFLQKKSWVTYGVIPSTKYSFALFIPEAELMESVGVLSRNIFWISVIVIVLITIGIVAISWRISTPIKSLSETARKIAEGNLNAEIRSYDAKNEIGELTKDLKTMVSTIKQTLNNVGEEKEKFERVFMTMSDAIVATDSNWNVINANKAAEHMLDIQAGVNFIKHLSENYKYDFDLQDLLDYKKREKYFEITRPETDQVKKMYFSAVINSIVDAHDQITAYVLTIRDITGERQEDLNKNTLLSLVSHKIMTPITVLLGIASLFQDKALGELQDNQVQQIDKMFVQVRKIQKLVEKLMKYVELTEDRSEDVLEIIDVKPFMQEFQRDGHFNENVHLSLVVSETVKKIRFNGSRFKTLLYELADNSTKFNQSKKIKIHILIDRDKRDLVIKIQDNGIGIPSVYHDRIFERFFQIDKDFTGNKGGIGLGLSLVNLIVLHYKGSIQLESHEGRGSLFVIRLPVEFV